MDPLLLKVKKSDAESFGINFFKYNSSFPGLWHYHAEYELTLIKKSSGTRFVGDHIDRYTENDLIFIGKNLAHTWKTDTSSEHKTDNESQALVVHFLEDFLGDTFFSRPEMVTVEKFLQISRRGVKITGQTQESIIVHMNQLEALNGAEKLIKLLEILTLLSKSKDLTLLSSEGYSHYINENKNDRLYQVHSFIMNNFKSQIKLTDAADIAHMSPTAFSRYFKQRMQKPFSQFIIELKIGYACKLLMQHQFSILQICYECGFQNVSNFNKLFKNYTKLSPKQYQLKYKSLHDPTAL